MRNRSYSDLSRLTTLEDRYDYLYLQGAVGDMTFGSNRWISQKFYHSREWRQVRDFVISRDGGMELGVPDWPIKRSPQIHHMNPINLEDVVEATENLLNPEFLISTSHRMHNNIHYGSREQLPRPFAERTAGDTVLW